MKNSSVRNPVLLIHGLWDTRAIFKTMTAYLSNLGWIVYSLDLIPNNGDAKLEILAQQVADFVTATFDSQQPFDIVGYSMGALVSRYYIQRLGGIKRVQRFVTLAAPHHGTITAYATRKPGCIQMQPNSAFLNDLNQDVTQLAQLNFTSIWTPFDMMIVPAISSKLPVGKNVLVPVAMHHLMVTDKNSLNAVAEALASPIQIASPTLANSRSPKIASQ